MLADGRTARYRVQGDPTGAITATFTRGTWSTVSTFTGPVAPVGFLVGTVATPNITYLDVRLAPIAGEQLVVGTITDADAELAFSGAGTGSIVLAPIAPVRLAGTSTYRFFLTGSFAPGAVEVRFIGASFSSTESGLLPTNPGDDQPTGNVEETETFVAQQLTADLVDPLPGSTIATEALNERGYIDVTYTIPAYATELDLASITDLEPEFTIAPAPAVTGTIALDHSKAPVLVGPPSGNAYIFRYFTTGTLSSGNVVLTFIGGSLLFRDAAGDTIPFFASHEVAVYDGPDSGPDFAIDVPFGPAGALDGTSISAADISIVGVTISAPVETNTAGTYRFGVTGTGLAVGTKLIVSYVNGSWTYGAAGGGTLLSVVESTRTMAKSAGTYIDVVFSTAGGVTLDANSILDTTGPRGAELALDGSGLGTGLTRVQLDSTKAPSILTDGRTVRYYLTGTFAPGKVTVEFLGGSWQDELGNPGTTGSASFQLIETVKQAAAGQAPDKVFFIDISGKMTLQLADLFDEPLLEIRGKVSLEIGDRKVKDNNNCYVYPTGTVTQLVAGCNVPLVGDTTEPIKRFRFALRASGTIKVIKLGNIASGAASFVLETGDEIQFWGVAAFQTNFEFLEQYGIYLKGSALLQFNATDSLQRETISLEGIPGGIVFALPTGSNSTALSSLPTDTFSPIALPAECWRVRRDRSSQSVGVGV